MRRIKCLLHAVIAVAFLCIPFFVSVGTNAEETVLAMTALAVEKDVPYVPTPMGVVDEMLKVAGVGSGMCYMISAAVTGG